jgi:error-prone DNA polymerase
MRSIIGLKQDHANLIVVRRCGGYKSVRDLWLRTGLPISVLETLAGADAFQSLGLSRRDALWAVRGLVGTHGAETLSLFTAAGLPASQAEPDAGLPAMPESEAVVHDYKAITLSLKKHPVHFLREDFDRRGYAPAESLSDIPAGRRVIVAGLVLVRQRPGTATGVVFSTLEDETGIANIVIWPKVFEKFRRIILGSRLMAVKGKLQKEGLVIHVIAEDFYDFTPQLLQLADGHDIGDHALARADEGRREGPETSGGRDDAAIRRREIAQRQARAALPKGRNFH